MACIEYFIYPKEGTSTYADWTKFYICDLIADKPSSGLQAGWLLYCKEDLKLYKATNGTTWADVAGSGGGTPASSVVSETAFGQGAAVGTSTDYARGDHTHGSPSLGTSASTACAGNDARLSDARTPTAHAASHQSGGSDAIKLDDLATPDDNTDLNASTLRHGLLPKLGGGTSNFLRADGAWAPPPGGGGSTKVRQVANQTKTDATLVNVTDLVFAVTSGTTYRFKFLVIFRSTVATVGLKLGLTFPGVTNFACLVEIPIAAAGAGGSLQGFIAASGGSVSGSAVPAINTDYCAVLEGVIRPSANGNVQLQFAAETTGATVTLKADSVGLLENF